MAIIVIMIVVETVGTIVLLVIIATIIVLRKINTGDDNCDENTKNNIEAPISIVEAVKLRF